MNKSKMYILIKDWVDVGHAMNSVAHGVLMAHLKWNGQTQYDTWLTHSFRKVTCRVTEEEFERAKSIQQPFSGVECVIVTESAFANQEIALVFKPREYGLVQSDPWREFFKGLTLFK